ncbi:MAG TPA: serine/threonine-protein kinase [Arenimonas sp.]|nr:serine/threonine-protein kinase [Arenimonas sp.]HPO23818.1 serine/threonine-protein kinase [Arenimonas sp.]
MHTERWATLSPLLDELLELSGDAREMRLYQMREQYPELAQELLKMMDLERSHPDFMAEPLANLDNLSPRINDEIGPYRLVSLLGEGGMGQVWLAVRSDGLYERRVALKLLRPGLGDAGLRQRFTRERQILARLAHANIARLLDAGIMADGQPYLALDYVNGEPITDYVKRLNLDLRSRLLLFRQVCDAVSHAHANLVVHRDLKPSNIMVTPNGEVMLLDFGIAKLLDHKTGEHTEITQTGHRTFTLHYAAPEQLRGEIISTLTDVYALGVVLYEILSGCKPYTPERKTDAAWEEAILKDEPIKPSQALLKNTVAIAQAHNKRVAKQLANDLDNVVLKALAKNPEARYASVESFKQDLLRYLDGQPVHARPDSLGYRTQKYIQRHAFAVVAGVGVSTVLAIALAITTWQANQAFREASRAEAMQGFVVALFENTGDKTNPEDVNVRELLDAGVRRADTELSNQPQARAELLGLIARLRSGLGDDREALRLLDKQSMAFMQLDINTPPELRLESLAVRGHSLRQLGQYNACIRDLAPYLQVAEDISDKAPKVSSAYFSELGRCHEDQGSLSVARDLFGKALQLRKDIVGDKALQAESLADLAKLLGDENKYSQAITQAREALSMLRQASGERNALGVGIWYDLGRFYRGAENLREAEAAFRQALDISQNRFGVNHPLNGPSQQALAEILIIKNEFDEASRLLSASKEHYQRQWGDENPRLADIAMQQAEVALQRDNPQDGIAFATEAQRLFAKSQQAAQYIAATCLLARAQTAQELNSPLAAQTAEQCLSLAVKQKLPQLQTYATAMANLAMDRDEITLADQRLKIATASSKTSSPELLLAWLRLQDLQKSFALDDSVFDRVQATLKQQVAMHADLLRASTALRANFYCRNQRSFDGEQLRTKILKEANLQIPERRFEIRQLQNLSKACH